MAYNLHYHFVGSHHNKLIMAKISALTNTWEIVKEIDLEPLREEALGGVKLVIIGRPGSGKKTLASQMRRDPQRQDILVDTPVITLDLEEPDLASGADLIILLLDARGTDFTREAELSRIWSGANLPVLVLINDFEGGERPAMLKKWVDWKSRRVVEGSILDQTFLTGKFARAVIDLLPNKSMALGRYFPLFRVPVANRMINDTCMTNATYSFTTGLVEIIPILNIPMTVTDTIVLTKNQAFMVYKLGLTLGLSTVWKDYITEFGGVLGSGFFFRQLARSLVSLVPLWGIVPKVGISYAGTYVVGNVILHWYLTGRHISKEQMKDLYARALESGKSLGRNLWNRHPFQRKFWFRLPWVRKPDLPRITPGRRGKTRRKNICPACENRNPRKASFCQFCGTQLNGDSPDAENKLKPESDLGDNQLEGAITDDR